MRVEVEVVAAPGEVPPPAGAPVSVEVRDVTYADAPAVTLGRVTAVAAPGPGGVVARATVEAAAPTSGASLVAWAHVDADRDGEVGAGDWVPRASHPVPSSGGTVRVVVRRLP